MTWRGRKKELYGCSAKPVNNVLQEVGAHVSLPKMKREDFMNIPSEDSGWQKPHNGISALNKSIKKRKRVQIWDKFLLSDETTHTNIKILYWPPPHLSNTVVLLCVGHAWLRMELAHCCLLIISPLLGATAWALYEFQPNSSKHTTSYFIIQQVSELKTLSLAKSGILSVELNSTC